MRRVALALFAVLLAVACSAEPPAESRPAAAPPAGQTEPSIETKPADRPSEPTAAARGADEPARVAQAGGPRPAEDGRFVAGKHYRVLNPAQPTNVAPGKVEVVDVFWYGCGGCYVMSPYLAAWKDARPGVAEYVKLPAALNPAWQPQARLYYATKALGIDDKTHAAIFREMHVNRNPLNTEERMIEFLAQYDVSEADAREALTSFTVDTELRAADVRTRRYRLNFVPAVVVNGKYVIGVEEAGGPEAMIDLINHLVALESGTVTQ